MIPKDTRRGFTLVELLIVIVVIGILSAMMMLSAAEIAASADATAIISNLRNWKTATLEWYVDNLDKVKENGHLTTDTTNDGKFRYADDVPSSEISKYLNDAVLKTEGNTIVDDAGGVYYTDYVGNYNTSSACMWVIVYKLPDKNNRTIEKLAARAKGVGLVNKYPDGDGFHDPYISSKTNGVQDTVYVAIKVIDFRK